MASSSQDRASKRRRVTDVTVPPSPDLFPPLFPYNRICFACRDAIEQVHRSSDRSQEIPMFFHKMSELHLSAITCHMCCLFLERIQLEGKTEIFSKELPAEADCSYESDPYLKQLNMLLVDCRTETGFTITLYHMPSTSHLPSPCSVNITFSYSDPDKLSNISHLRSSHTGSEDSWAQLLRWKEECLSSHPLCKTERTGSSRKPKRIIEIGAASDPRIRVLETDRIDTHFESLVYTTLSHRWGQIKPLQLLQENYLDFQSGVLVSSLPRTFRDAVHATRALGIQYLWIDSLCIIQDSAADWETESVLMSYVYKNSILNLAALGSSDSEGGLFHHRNPLAVVPCVVDVPELDTGPMHAISDYENECIDDKSLDLLKRGWVFQEIVPSSRTVLFGKKELHWQCRELDASETYPGGSRPSYGLSSESVSENYQGGSWTELLRNWRSATTQDEDSKSMMWRDIIAQYSETKLTRISDRLIAVAGLAVELSRSRDGVCYLAGMWSHSLADDLLWYSAPWPRSTSRGYIAPSWSWASVNEEIGYLPSCDYPRDILIEIIRTHVDCSLGDRVSTTISDPDLTSFSQILGGHLDVKGLLVPATLSKLSKEKQNRPGDRGREWRIRIPDWGLLRGAEINGEQPGWWVPKIPAVVFWDTADMEHMMRKAEVFLLPIQVTSQPRDKFSAGLNLYGLILIPTYINDGEYRRIGCFQLEDIFFSGWTHLQSTICGRDTNNNEHSANPSFQAGDDSEKANLSPRVGLRGATQEPVSIYEQKRINNTAGSIPYLISPNDVLPDENPSVKYKSSTSAEETCVQLPPSVSEGPSRIVEATPSTGQEETSGAEKSLHPTTLLICEIFDQKEKQFKANSLHERDKRIHRFREWLGNQTGSLNTTLHDRYSGSLDPSDYPHIHSLLSCSGLLTPTDNGCPQGYLHKYEDGFIMIRIV